MSILEQFKLVEDFRIEIITEQLLYTLFALIIGKEHAIGERAFEFVYQ